MLPTECVDVALAPSALVIDPPIGAPFLHLPSFTNDRC